VIIRSGLIRNREGVAKNVFDQHWRDVHGPLARVVPDMRAYAQNHVLACVGTASAKLHRIDGISQLWFDDVAAMIHAMASPEQAACVEDIKGFLDEVTLVIQSPGEWTHIGKRAATRSKVMAVLGGDPHDAVVYRNRLREWFADTAARGGSVRLNPVVERGHIVDRSVSRGNDIVAAIAELWFNDPEEVNKARTLAALDGSVRSLECMTALHVEEIVILERPADAPGH
jgi:uncharacterized protein (TIGR02118 family)